MYETILIIIGNFATIDINNQWSFDNHHYVNDKFSICYFYFIAYFGINFIPKFSESHSQGNCV